MWLLVVFVAVVSTSPVKVTVKVAVVVTKVVDRTKTATESNQPLASSSHPVMLANWSSCFEVLYKS